MKIEVKGNRYGMRDLVSLRTAWFKHVCFRFAQALSECRSNDHRAFGIIGCFRAEMFYSSFPFCTQKVKAETVVVQVCLGQQLGSQHRPLRWIDETLEDGILNPLSSVFAHVRYTAQPTLSIVISCAYIVTDENHHG